MKIFGLQVRDYIRIFWPYIMITAMLGIMQLFLFKYQIITLDSMNVTFLPQAVLLLIMGVMMHSRGLDKLQTATGSILCLIGDIWLPPQLMTGLNAPTSYLIMYLLLTYVMNLAVYVALALLGWFLRNIIVRKVMPGPRRKKAAPTGKKTRKR